MREWIFNKEGTATPATNRHTWSCKVGPGYCLTIGTQSVKIFILIHRKSNLDNYLYFQPLPGRISCYTYLLVSKDLRCRVS